MTLFTIGFTKKNAQEFFTLLQTAGVRRIIDIRLNNVSQLAGYTKRDDLKFFLRELCDADYVHLPRCAPSKEILDHYKKNKGTWEEYETHFRPLIAKRQIENILTPEILDKGCLLCSEPTPEQCHRHLVAEYMQEQLPDLVVEHL